jgi:hypothetical protein
MSIEAMQLALEALTRIWEDGLENFPESGHDAAITALRTAIESAEKQEPVAHSVVAGALFDFMGWLTSRDKRLTLSSTDEAGPAVEATTEFAKMRGLRLEDAQVEHWQAILTTPPAAQRQWVGLTDEQINQYDYQYRDLLYDVEKMLRENNA